MDINKDNISILKEALHLNGHEQLLKDAITEYNQRQKRKDRRMTYNDLFKPNNKQHIQLYEKIVQFGNSNNAPNTEDQKILMRRAFKDLRELDPYFVPIAMAMHFDEGTPHMHITGYYLNFNRDRKQGILFDFSADRIHGGRQGIKDFYYTNIDTLNEVAHVRGYEIQNPGLKLKHVDPTIKNKLVYLEQENERLKKELQQERERSMERTAGRF
jgi:hypothetical protein